ncbi:MAG: alpha/beta hydrolase, partial [Quisquiliibacterium sp.]
VVAAYRRDPLVHARICARVANWMFSSARRTLELAPQLRVPTLVLLPEADRIVDPQGALQFAERAPRSLVMLCRYPGLLHEPFNERLQDRAWVYADLSAWLEQLEA